MRRLLLPFCFAVLALGIAIGSGGRPPEAAVATRAASAPFPAVWRLQATPEAAAAAAGTFAAVRAANEARWYSVAVWNEAVAANARALASRSHPSSPTRRTAGPRSGESGTGACGGDLPPCSVMMCESGGSLTAQNPRSTASGKWQILDSTWNGYGGYASAADAPEAVQDARAREIYRGGAGRRAWVC